MGSGAAEIFGTSGGVAEAVARYCMPDKSKNALRMLEHSGLRGSEPIRFVTLPIGDREVHIALAHGLSNASKLLDQIETARCRSTWSRSCPAARAASVARASPTR